jgi:hypothetical protein
MAKESKQKKSEYDIATAQRNFELLPMLVVFGILIVIFISIIMLGFFGWLLGLWIGWW